jgi:hypothetical protein
MKQITVDDAVLVLTMKQITVDDAVLVFSKKSKANQAAKIHRSSCGVVTRAKGNQNFAIVDSDVTDETNDLIKRGYKVTVCECVK